MLKKIGRRALPMPRPCFPRRIAFIPGFTYFKPAGIPLRSLAEVSLSPDELEALRLADFEGRYQEAGARKMGVSRQTFGRIVEIARKKVAEALVEGKAIRLEGGLAAAGIRHRYHCCRCRRSWWVSPASAHPGKCPSCRRGRVGPVGEIEFQPQTAPGAEKAGQRGPGRDRRHCVRNRVPPKKK